MVSNRDQNTPEVFDEGPLALIVMIKTRDSGKIETFGQKLALSKILHSDMRDFFQTDFGKEYYQKWLKEHGKNKPKYTQYDYEEDEDE